MANVKIVEELKGDVFKKFKGESLTVFRFMKSLEENPHKSKIVGNVGGIIIKELKYKNFRFYFIIEGNKLKVFSKNELINLLIKFVRMSNKKSQRKVINEIKSVLRKIGDDNF